MIKKLYDFEHVQNKRSGIVSHKKPGKIVYQTGRNAICTCYIQCTRSVEAAW